MCIDLFSIGNFTVHGYGLMIGIGFVIAVLMASKIADSCGLSSDDTTNIAICVLLFGFLGGKILFCIVEFEQFLADPLSCIGTSGFVVYGGVITGILSIIIYCKIKKRSFADYMDVLVPGIAVNQGFGRIGCFLAGCCYGRETDSFLGVVFPEGCLAPAGIKLLPTQLFSAAFDIALGIFLIWLYRIIKNRGEIALSYLGLYAIGRFIVEMMRNDRRGNVGIFTTSQFIAILMLVGVVILYFVNIKFFAAEPSVGKLKSFKDIIGSKIEKKGEDSKEA